MGNKKALLHAKMWYVYVNEEEIIIKGGCLVEVVGYDRKKVLLEVVDDHVLEEENYHDEIVLCSLIAQKILKFIIMIL